MEHGKGWNSLMSQENLDPRIIEFHDRALELLETSGDILTTRQEIRRQLIVLAGEPEILPDVALDRLHTTGSSATILREGPDGRAALMLLRLPAAAPTPVHNHNSWGVSCVVQGRNRYWAWSRRDAGDNPDQADLRLDLMVDQSPGDAMLWDDPPQDWHAQQGIDDDAIEFVFFGVNPLHQPRAYYDPESNAVTYAYASEPMISSS